MPQCAGGRYSQHCSKQRPQRSGPVWKPYSLTHALHSSAEGRLTCGQREPLAAQSSTQGTELGPAGPPPHSLPHSRRCLCAKAACCRPVVRRTLSAKICSASVSDATSLSASADPSMSVTSAAYLQQCTSRRTLRGGEAVCTAGGAIEAFERVHLSMRIGALKPLYRPK